MLLSLTPSSSLSQFYNIFQRRTSISIITVMAGAFAFEAFFDPFTNQMFRNFNKGVSRAGRVLAAAHRQCWSWC